MKSTRRLESALAERFIASGEHVQPRKVTPPPVRLHHVPGVRRRNQGKVKGLKRKNPPRFPETASSFKFDPAWIARRAQIGSTRDGVILPCSSSNTRRVRSMLASSIIGAAPAKIGGPPGSLGRLIAEYMASTQFKRLKPSSAAVQRRIFEGLAKEHGDRLVAEMRRRT